MHRLDGCDRPAGSGAESTTFAGPFQDLRARRRVTDARLIRWASGAETGGDLTWFSGASGREITRPRALCIAQVFNHQTHHRGQVHAMMTAAGRSLPDTDLFLMPEDA